MSFERETDDRAAFDAALAAHLASVFPAARQEWLEDGRRLMLYFDDGCTCTLYEPNFFFAYPSFSTERLFAQAERAIAGQHAMLLRREVI